MNDSTALALQVYQQAAAAANKYNREVKEALAALKAICEHPEDKLENKSTYYEGGYLNTAYTEYWCVCTICGQASERTTKDHGWFN